METFILNCYNISQFFTVFLIKFSRRDFF